MKTRLTGAICAITVSAAVPAQAQTPAQPKVLPEKTGKIEEWLKERLSYVVQSCVDGNGPIKMRDKVDGSKEASPVPRDMTRYITTTGKPNYWSLGDVGTQRHFAYVYSQADVEGRKFPNIAKRYLDLEFNTSAEDLLLRGGTNLQEFSQNCDAAFSAASAAGGGLADDTFKAAGKIAVGGSQTRRANISAGLFVSPFVSALNGADSAKKFFSSLILWDWKRRNDGGTGYLLTQFDGYAMSTSVEKKMSADASANASGGLTLPFLSFRSTAQANYQAASTYKAELFSVISTAPLSGSVDGADYYAVPTEAALNSDIRGTAKTQIVAYDDVLIGGVAKSVFVDVAWMPKIFCGNYNDYEIAGDSRSQMAITQLEDRSSEGYCRFTVTYRSLASNGVGSIDVPFEIHRKAIPAPVNLAGFSLPVSGLQFQWSDVPKLAPNKNMLELASLETVGDSQRLKWQAGGLIFDKDKLAVGSPTLSGLLLNCKGIGGMPLRPEGSMVLQNRSSGRIEFQLTLELLFPQSPANDIRGDGKPFRACALSGTIQYTIDGKPVLRPLNDQLYLKLPELVAPTPVY